MLHSKLQRIRVPVKSNRVWKDEGLYEAETTETEYEDVD